MYLLKWGLVSFDLRIILFCLRFLIVGSNSDINFSQKTINSFDIKSIAFSLTPTNAIFIPSSQITAKTTFAIKRGDTISNNVFCNESEIILLGENPVYLSKTKSPKLQFCQNPIFEKYLNHPIVYSNGEYAIQTEACIVVYSKSEDKEYSSAIINESNISNYPTSLSDVITSDGYYIYCLYLTYIEPKIGVFSCNNHKLIFHRFITLCDYQNGWNGQILVTNGVTISIIEESIAAKTQCYTFSLHNGDMIHKETITLKYNIKSAIYDPWCNCYWIFSCDKSNIILVYKMKNYGPQPSWLTGIELNTVSNLKQAVTDKNMVIRNFNDLCELLISHLSYYATYCNGSSLLSLSMKDQKVDKDISFFFGCSTPSIIQILFDFLNFLINCFSTPSTFEKSLLEIAIISTISLLSNNLSNNVYLVKQNESKYKINSELISSIIQKLEELLSMPYFGFCHQSIRFLIVNSFETLFSDAENCSKCSRMFEIVMKDQLLSVQFAYFIRIRKLRELTFCLGGSVFFFQSFLQKAALTECSTKSLSTKIIHMEFINSFFSQLISELLRIYNNPPSTFTNQEKLIQKSYFEFTKLLTYQLLTIFRNSQRSNNLINTFVFYLFRRFLLLSFPLSNYSRLSATFSFLQSIYDSYQEFLKREASKFLQDKETIRQYELTMNELFLLNADYLCVLVNGGFEMKELLVYKWLPKAIRNCNFDMLGYVYYNVANGQILGPQVKQYLMSRIFPRSNQEIEGFVENVISIRCHETVSNFFSDLYKHKPGVPKNPIDEQEKYLERVFIMALVTQINYIKSFYGLYCKSLLGLNSNGLPKYIDTCLINVHKLRRDIAKKKRSLTAEKYEKYVYSILEKSLFLLQIKNERNVIKSSGTDEYLKKLFQFIDSEKSLSDYQELLVTAENVRRYGTNGMIQIINLFKKMSASSLRDYFIYILNRNNIISAYFEKFNSFDVSEKKEIPKEIDLISLIESITSSIQTLKQWPILLNYVTLVVSISALMAEYNDGRCIKNILTICESIYMKKNELNISINNVYSLLTFIFTHFSFYTYDTLIKNGMDKFDVSFFENGEIDPDYSLILKYIKPFILHGNREEINMAMIADNLRNCTPVMLHSLLHWISHILKSNDELKCQVIKLFLNEISTIASGNANNLLLSKIKPLAYTNLSEGVSHCKTANHILSCCNELICFCRRLLEEKDQDMIDIITYILETFNPYPSLKIAIIRVNPEPSDENLAQDPSNQNTKTDQDESPHSIKEEVKLLFNNKLYLFAVFAILSNTINCIHQHSLIQSTEQGHVYYLDYIDYQKNLAYAWNIPYTNSAPVELKLSSVSPLSLISFAPSLYSEIQLLIPYFISFIENDNLDYSLSLYVFQSLLDYFEDMTFTSTFLNVLHKQNVKLTGMPKIGQNSISILKKILSIKYHKSILSPIIVSFDIAAPYDSIKDCQNLVGKDFLISNSSSLLFISSFLTYSQTGYHFLSIDATNTGLFDIGLFSPNIYGGSNYSFIYSRRENNKCFICDHSTTFTAMPMISFDHNTKECILFDNSTKKKLYSTIMPDGNFAFIVVLYGKVFVNYKITTEPSDGYDIFFPNIVKASAIENSSMSNIVFHRKRIHPGNNHSILQPKGNCISVSNWDSENYVKIVRQPSKPKIEHVETIDDSDLITFPSFLIQRCIALHGFASQSESSKYISYEKKSLDYSKQPQPNFIPDANYCCYYKIPNQSEMAVNKLDDEKCHVYIDEQCRIQRIEGTIQSQAVSQIPNISIDQYGILPRSILDYYLVNCSQNTKVGINNTIFIHYIAASNEPLDQALKLFNINDKQLFKYFTSLLTIVEKFDLTNQNKNQIQLNTNILLNSFIPAQNVCNEYHALTKIYSYILENDQFAQIWALAIHSSFMNPKSYFALDSNPYSIYVPPNTSTEIIRKGIDGYIILIASLKNDLQKSDNSIDTSLRVIENSTIKLCTKRYGLVVIPYSNSNNSYLIGTYLDFFVSFKYFVQFISTKAEKNVLRYKSIRTTIYCDFLKALIYSPPYLQFAGSDFLSYLDRILPTTYVDFTDEFIGYLNLFNAISNDSRITHFYKIQELKFKEYQLLSFKSHFPEFLTDTELDQLQYVDTTKKVTVPDSPIPDRYDSNNSFYYITVLDKYFTKREPIIRGFPFYYVCEKWVLYLHKYPQIKSTVLNSGRTLEIEFEFKTRNNITLVPHKISMNILNKNLDNILLCMTLTPNEPAKPFLKPNDGWKVPSHIFETPNQQATKLYFHISTIDFSRISWDSLIFYISSPDLHDEKSKVDLKEFEWQFLNENRILFQKDIEHEFSLSLDHHIVESYYKLLSQNDILSKFNPTEFLCKHKEVPLYLLMIRSEFLVFLNLVFIHSKKELDADKKILGKLIPYLSKQKKYDTLLEHVRKKQSDSTPDLKINRMIGRNVRDGNSEDFTQTIIAQMSKYYEKIGKSSFRNVSEKPWKVKFHNETGIDAGGLARELLTECVDDLSTSNSGLVIPTPNSQSDTNQIQMVIPKPNPKISDAISSKLYRFVGALIAICVRTTLVQPFMFPPFVWQYLVDGILDIQSIYSIDEKYSKQIEALQKVISTGSFEGYDGYEPNFVVSNLNGEQIPLTLNGQNEKINLSNALTYISLATEYRLNEIKPHLEAIRSGFWENLDIQPSDVYLDGPTLEYAACGETEISFEEIKKYTVFRVDDTQKRYFLQVVEKFTSEERSLLLQFSTAVPRIPPNRDPNNPFLIVDNYRSTDTLPHASTCFNQFHCPIYTSFENAYKFIHMAIAYGGTLND